MRMIYIAGAYSAFNNETIMENIKLAIHAGESVYKLGYIPVIPHFFHWWDFEYPKQYEEWMTICLSVIDHCQGVYRMPNSISKGADREVQYAQTVLKIPVFYELSRLEKYNWTASKGVL